MHFVVHGCKSERFTFFLIDGGVTYSRFFAVNCRREEFCSRVVVRHMSVWSTVEPNGLSCVVSDE